jgi:hypothetical protein
VSVERVGAVEVVTDPEPTIPEMMSVLPDVGERLAEADVLLLRVRELEAEVQRLTDYADEQTHRREDAEAGRDQWIHIAETRGIVPGKTQHLSDPARAITAAQAAERRAHRRAAYREREIRRLNEVVDGLVRLVYLMPKLPAKPKALHPDIRAALVWAYSRHARELTGTIFDPPALPLEVRVELAECYAADLRVLGRMDRVIADRFGVEVTHVCAEATL